MKDQYYGDINDYRKYGLLRVLQRQGQGTLLLAWMLTPDDGSGDGRLCRYLDFPGRWRPYDPGLFDALAHVPRTGSGRNVRLMERSGLLPGTTYYSALVPDAAGQRRTWRQGLLAAARGLDLVFLDPDNGLEVPSKPLGRRGSHKYVFWHELEELWAAGHSLLIFQYFPRVPRQAFAARLASEVAGRTAAPLVQALRAGNVLYLLAAQERHVARFQAAIPAVLEAWPGQIVPLELAMGI